MLKKIALLLVLMTFTLTLSACEPFDVILGLDIESVSLDRSSLKEIYYLEEFDISTIKLVVIKDDGEIERVSMRMSMFNREDREKLAQAGRHTVTARYRGFDVEFEIRLSSQTTL